MIKSKKKKKILILQIKKKTFKAPEGRFLKRSTEVPIKAQGSKSEESVTTRNTQDTK